MKKIIILLCMLLLGTSTSVYSADCGYTCVTPYDTNNKFSSFISRVSGLNFSASKIGESIIRKSIAKAGDNNKKLKVNIDSYSAKDLSNGIFKSLTITGSDINIDGIYLSHIKLKSLCDFNYIKYDKKGNLLFKEDFPMSFDVKMSADDINNSMKSAKYQKVISDLNRLSVLGVKVSSTSVSIRGNRFYYTIMIAIPFIKKEKRIEITADLVVNNGEIDFENTRLTSNSYSFDLKKINYILNYLNPLDFSVNIFNNKNAKIYIKNFAMRNNEMYVDGIVVIPKD